MKSFKKIMTVLILTLISLLLFHTLNYYYPKNLVQRTLNGLMLVLTPVLISAVLVYLVNPFTDLLIKKYKFRKNIAIIVTISLLALVLVLVIGFVGYFLITQGKDLLAAILKPEFVNDIKLWFESYNLLKVYTFIETFIVNFDLETLFGPVSSVLSIILQGLTAIILVPIFLWHILNYKENMFTHLEGNIPTTWKDHVIPIAVKSNYVLSSYFKSKILSMLMLFGMFIFVYLGLGLPIGYVILFAILISLLDIVPYLGPSLALLVPIVYIFSVDGVNLFYLNNWHINAILANIILIGVNFLIQLIQGNYIVPKLAGKEMDINPALILVFMLFFGSILGIWGIILSIPLGGIILVIWEHMKESGFLDNKVKDK